MEARRPRVEIEARLPAKWKMGGEAVDFDSSGLKIESPAVIAIQEFSF
uniref:Uncharacterized protein n=1 Tax=Arundo donax TaxID=35708 RepID=A0A0A9EJB4_ARUDO